MKAQDVVLVGYKFYNGDVVEYLIEIKDVSDHKIFGTVLEKAEYFTVGQNIEMRFSNILSIVPAERPGPVPEDGMMVRTSGGDILTRINGEWYRSSMHDDESVLSLLKYGAWKIVE